MDRAVTVVCEHCHCILDAKDPNLKILQQYNERIQQDRPLIPLGTRGKLRGTDYEVIGFQRRTITEDGIDYSWHEYLLFNPYKGYRYLVEYNGHWNDVAPVTGLPTTMGTRAEYLGKSYRHFQTAEAHTTFVLGEFPWQVRYGESAICTDYVHAPYMLSAEVMASETTWSLGEYMYGSEIWRSFNLAGSPPPAIGVYENEPSKASGSAGAVWLTFFALAAALLVILVANYIVSGRDVVFEHSYSFTQQAGQEPSFVTPEFDLKGRTSDIEVETAASVNNQWIYVNYALINDATGQAYDFAREVTYYHGRDSDGDWTEGDRDDKVYVPAVPAGGYYLRVEPESDAKFGPVQYSVKVTRDEPVMSLYLIALVALLFPALLISWRAFNFERMRWAESDHPLVRTSNG
jgi:hypothetical protein